MDAIFVPEDLMGDERAVRKTMGFPADVSLNQF